MRRNRNIWEWLEESTEGPSVTLTLPREVAEQLMSMLGSALEVDDMEGGDDAEFGMAPPGGDDADIDIPFGDIGDGGDMGEPDLGADDDMMPAGDEDEPAPPKKSPPKPKKDGGEKKKSDDKPKKDDKEKDKKESVTESVRRLAGYVPRGRR